MSSLPVFGYYNLRGWAGSIRLLLAYLGVDYEEKLYPWPTHGGKQDLWLEEKDTLGLDFPNLPYWIAEEIKLTETKAILKHVCRRYDVGLMGITLHQQSQVNMLEEIIWDLWNSLTKTCLEDTAELRNLFKINAPRKLAQLSKFLSGNKWSIGNSITYVDFMLYEVCCQHKAFEPEILLPYPNLEKLLSKIENLESISNYMNGEGYISKPFYSPKFKCKL